MIIILTINVFDLDAETELGRTKSSEKTAKEGLSRVSKTAEEQASSLTQLSQLNKSLQENVMIPHGVYKT